MASLTLIFLLPLGYVVVTFLVLFGHVNKIPPLHMVSLDSYKKLSEDYPMLQWYVGTVLVTALTLTRSITISPLTGYALTKLEFEGWKFVFNNVLATLMISFQPLLTSSYIMVASLGRHNMIRRLMIPFMVSSLSTFMVRQSYLPIPDELIEVARTDGLGYIGSYFCVVLPPSGPLISTSVILNFTSRWNAYLVPSASLAKMERFTLAVGLNTTKAANFIRLNETMVGVMPLNSSVLTVFFFLQKGSTEGITSSRTEG